MQAVSRRFPVKLSMLRFGLFVLENPSGKHSIKQGLHKRRAKKLITFLAFKRQPQGFFQTGF